MERDNSDYFGGQSSVRELKHSDFSQIATWKLLNKECSVVLFYCAWCPFCKAIKQDWEKLGKTALFMNVYAMNCEKEKAHISKIKNDMPELVKGYPTIIFYSKGEPIESYEGERDYANILKACMRICQGR